MHGRHRSPDRPLPPSHKRRILPWPGLPDAVRPALVRSRPVLTFCAGRDAVLVARGVLPAAALRQRRPDLLDCATVHAPAVPASVCT